MSSSKSAGYFTGHVALGMYCLLVVRIAVVAVGTLAAAVGIAAAAADVDCVPLVRKH